MFDACVDWVASRRKVFSTCLAISLFASRWSEADLVTNWRLDDTGAPAVSDVNSIYNGSFTNGSGVLAYQPGKIGTAYSFSGGNVLVDPSGASSPPAPAPSPLGTVSAWIKPDSGDWTGNIVFNQNPTYIQFRYESDGAGQRLVYRQDGGHDVVVSSSNGAVSSGVWTHVVATVEPSAIKLYMNGTLGVTGGGSNGYVSSNGTLLQIGGGAGSNFQGLIDDVAIWNTALSEGRIGTMSSILAVNNGALGGYNAYLMNDLFTVYDTGTPEAISQNGSTVTWSKFTGGAGTAGSVTYSGGQYYAWFDANSGVVGSVPEIDPSGAGSVVAGLVGFLGLIERRRISHRR